MPSSPSRLKRLATALDALAGNSEPMSVSALDGFLAGILVCPDRIEPSEWLPRVWAPDGEAARPVFGSFSEARSLVMLVLDHYQEVAEVLFRRPETYQPILEIDTRSEEILWQSWVEGFEAAMRLRPRAWRPLVEAKGDASYALSIMLALSEIGDTGVCSARTVAVNDLCTEAPVLIPVIVRALNAFRHRQMTTTRAASPPRRATRLGQARRCPCGSGKDYMRCCGLN
jgi:uncharacterized protein